ncbi:DUF4352 domain-containing protein [Streptomyces hydrogenans]|uniref:DUF4352 domain-containing protein n=1 Tax=Streptomyces hydrogenans TaxID=1873719 RepID=UPI0035DD403C
MNKYVRRVSQAVAVGAAAALLAACGSTAEPVAQKPAEKPSVAPTTAAPEATTPSASSSSAAPKVAELRIGDTGRFTDMETDDDGIEAAPNTEFEVKAVSAKYATPEEVGTSNKPKNGQFLVLTLTVKNVGSKSGEFASYGMMKWETEGTAAQDASTLESVDGPELDTTYKPGQSVTGKLVLDVGGKGGLVSYFDGLSDVPSVVVSIPSK